LQGHAVQSGNTGILTDAADQTEARNLLKPYQNRIKTPSFGPLQVVD